MRKALSFVLSAMMMSGLLSLLWVIGVVGQHPQIPVQTPDVNYIDIMLRKKKHNPIDDLYPIHQPYSIEPQGSAIR